MDSISLAEIQKSLDAYAENAERRGDYSAWRYWRGLAHANRSVIIGAGGIDEGEREDWAKKISKLYP